MEITILGCGGHAKVVSEIASLNGFSNQKFIDTTGKKKTFLGGHVTDCIPQDYAGNFSIAIGDNFHRKRLATIFSRQNPLARFATLIHPTAIVSKSAMLDAGVVIMPGAVVNTGANVMQGVIVNSSAVVEHDNKLHQFSSLAPGVVTGGNVELGECSCLCIGSIVFGGINIGPHTLIGAGSLLTKDADSKSIYYGSPAVRIRARDTNESYL